MWRKLGCLVLLSSQALAQEEEPRALMVGSSSVNGAVGITIDRELATLGIELDRRAHDSSGFARPDFFDFEDEVEELAPFDGYVAIFIYAGGNDAQRLRLRAHETSTNERWVRWNDEPRWSEIYAGRVRSVVDAMCARGARRVIVVPPIDGGREGWSRRIQRVIAAQRAGAAASRCGVAVDANDGTAFASVDGVHLSYSGARRMWERIGPSIRELLGLSE